MFRTVVNPTTDYDFDLDLGIDWKGPCVYVKASSSYSAREVVCSKKYMFICQWTSKRTKSVVEIKL